MTVTPSQRKALRWIATFTGGAPPLNGHHRRTFAALTKKGLAVRDGGRWRLTERGVREARR